MFGNFWLYVTEACNLRCKYCFNPDKIFTNSQTITFENYKKIFDNIILLNKASSPADKKLKITLFGGEPSLYPDLLEKIIKYSYDTTGGQVKFQLLSNGVDIYKKGDLFKNLHENYKLGVQLSIDSDPEKPSDRIYKYDHNKYTEKIKKTFDFLFQNSIRFNIRATLVPAYLNDYYENFLYFVNLYRKNGLNSPYISIIPDFMYTVWNENDYETLDREAEKIVKLVKEYYENHSIVLRESFTKRALTILYHENIKKEKKIKTTLCGFADNIFAVSPDGKLYACHRVYKEKNMEIGNLLDYDIDFEKIEAIHSLFNNRCLVRPHPGLNLKSCDECDLRYACGMICPAYLYVSTDEQLNVYCNQVVHKFYSIYLKHVKNHLWSLIEREDFKNQVCRIVKGQTDKL